jgi:phosphoribosylamine--glycine ligase
MKILVVGSGAREHALVWTLTQDPAVTEVVCTPGNPGIAAIARCLPADIAHPQQVFDVAVATGVDLTVVGPEMPLSNGLTDLFEAHGRLIVGPTRAAAALEWSKAFAKDFMARHGIPTAKFQVCSGPEEALKVVASGSFGYPLVIKADGLAAGKGVVIAEDRDAADAAVRSMMVDRRFGAAGERIVFEEFLAGQEASYFVLSDGEAFVNLSSAQDHKRIFDGDRGPNTGGMGAFAPSPLVTEAIERRVIDEIVRPVLDGMRREGYPYRGFLYVGLMLTTAGPKVIEFNVRFGDPEAQVILPMLGESLANLLMLAARRALPSRPAVFTSERLVGVVLAAGGYPDDPESGRVITGVDRAAAEPGALVFHAGTTLTDGALVTAGGRVMTVVGRGATYQQAIDAAYRAAAHVRFDGMQYRSDIGKKALTATA